MASSQEARRAPWRLAAERPLHVLMVAGKQLQLSPLNQAHCAEPKGLGAASPSSQEPDGPGLPPGGSWGLWASQAKLGQQGQSGSVWWSMTSSDVTFYW